MGIPHKQALSAVEKSRIVRMYPVDEACMSETAGRNRIE